MGKRRRRNNRNRSEESSKSTDGLSVTQSVDKPGPSKPSTFKSILENSGRGDDNPSSSNRTRDDKNTGQSSSDCSCNPISKEYQSIIPVPRVQSNREWREANRRNDPYHYSLWRNAYDSYLWILFDGTQDILNSFKVHLEEEISFETFAFFIYKFSSGYISPYA